MTNGIRLVQHHYISDRPPPSMATAQPTWTIVREHLFAPWWRGPAWFVTTEVIHQVQLQLSRARRSRSTP